jgi:hypothetical protein
MSVREPFPPSVSSVASVVASLSDDELLRRLSELLRRSRRAEAELVAHIGEVDERRLYAREASPSMFAYCTDVLHLSEHEAYLRIAVARAARLHPAIFPMLADGRLHLSGIAKLAPHLDADKAQALLARAAHKSKRAIEELVAEIAPRVDVVAHVRKVPTRRQDPLVPPSPATLPLEPGPDRAVTLLAPATPPPAVVQLLSPERYKVQFTASATLHQKLRRLQALMRHAVPDGDLARLVEDAVTEKIERLEARRFAKTNAPRKSVEESDTSASGPRKAPAAVRRAVAARDDGRCRYVGANGRTCDTRAWIEFDHGKAYGRGGDRSLSNMRLMCRTHNREMAEREYGKKVMEKFRRRPPGNSKEQT